jgi:alpha-L-rhamnosidase
VRGSVPTPHGTIAVDFDTKSGRGEITIPMGSIGRIGIPTRGRAVRALSINGKLAWDGGFRQTANIGGATACENFLYFDDVPSGRYVLSVKYEGNVPLPPQKPLLYSMNAPAENSRSRGSWGGVYGQDGYVLFDYDGDGQSRQALPSYVVSVRPSVRKLGVCRHAQIISFTAEDRALAPDRANGQARKVGQLFTAAPAACQQTMTVDVEVTQNSHYQLALYFLDWEKQGRSQAIEIFDLKTLLRIAPVQIVRDFAQGKYLIYSCDRSLRLRVNQVRGETAVLNALFFDPMTDDGTAARRGPQRSHTDVESGGGRRHG